MSAKTGLLVIKNLKQIGWVLSSVQQKVSKILYIQFLNALDNPGELSNNLPLLPKYSEDINGIYSQAARHCKNLDVRVLLSGIKSNPNKITTQNPIDLVIFDDSHNKSDIESLIRGKISSLTKNYNILTLNDMPEQKIEISTSLGSNEEIINKIFKHGVIGGTFDRLHIGHKLLLSELILRIDSKITIGITDDNMIKGKLLYELIQDLSLRIENVRDFMNDVCPEIPCNIVPISDPFGPSIVDPTMDMLVVSRETIRGGKKINEIRESKGLPPLYIHPIELLEEPENKFVEELKISSSTSRMRLLGTVIKPIEVNKNIPIRPYVIGLTGGIASGKSALSEMLREMGALVIDADKLAHDIYKLGKPCYTKLIEQFGDCIIGQGGEVDRKKLGAIVFKDRNQLEKLNNIVWPEMLKDILEIVRNAEQDVVVIDAAILLTAEWHHHCHEVWATFLPREEAIKRLMDRNQLNEEQAMLRIQAQPDNSSYISSANVIFSSLWEKDYTQQQVRKAWTLLRERMSVQDDQRAFCNN